MEKKGLISVIVPIYKVEKYLEVCIESIINQTYTELEIILIDDNSPDGCGEICDRYAKIDDRIIVIHQKNGGAAAARNAGLRVATGEYISFVDSDDYLELDAYEKLLKALQKFNADIVQGDFRFIYVNHQNIHQANYNIRHFSTIDYLTYFTEEWTCALCWDKLFRRDVLLNVFFEEGHLIDDEFFTYKGVMNAKKITYVPEVIYNYRQRASSVMKDQNQKERKSFDAIEAIEKRRDDISVRFPELKFFYENHYINYLMWLAESEEATKNTVIQIKKRLLIFVCSRRVPLWKKGQRKRAVRLFSFFVRPVGKVREKQEKVIKGSVYEFFE